MADLSVVILNWNARPFLVACLRSILDQNWRAEIEVIVVDNDSRIDDSVAVMKRDFPHVTLLENPTNCGFGAGNNVGWKRASGRYVLFLNPDTIVESGALDRLVDWMDAHPNVGACGPRMTFPDGELQFSARAFPSFGAGLFRNSWLGKLWPNNPWSRGYLGQNVAPGAERSVDWLSGSALLGRREALESVDTGRGPWDEEFFMYCEDVDLCYRLGERGWPRFYVPGATIQHHIGRSSDLAQGKSIRRHHIAMWQFYRKHYMKGTGVLLAPFAFAGIGARALFASVKLARTYADMGILRRVFRSKVAARRGKGR